MKIQQYPVFEALDYRAPYLIEKLLKERIVATAEEGEDLFREAVRFLVMVEVDRSKVWEMHSLRVDEAWHQFVLFTGQYIGFCQRYFHRYVPHSPSNAPELAEPDSVEVASFDEFRQRYQELFGEPLPDAWYDEKSVTPDRRILNDHAGDLTLRDEDGMVELVDACGETVLAVAELGRPALAFIARTGAFYVRELPGGLDDEEKVTLVAVLVEDRLLRVGS
jgi:hypothetical protein